jgi:hypothetical protein
MRPVKPRRLRMLAAIACLHVAMAVTPVRAAPAAAAAPSAEEVKQGQYALKILMSALQAPNVPGPIKNALFACIYTNSISKISKAMYQGAAANKIDIKVPDKALVVLAGVCGYKPTPPATR